MTFNILLTTKFALSQLHTASEVKIHSVYQKTVNLLCDDRLISLHPKGTPLSPIGMLVDMYETEFSLLGFSVGDIVSVSQDGFRIGSVYFSLQIADTISTGLSVISYDVEKKLCNMVSDALRFSPQNVVFCDLLLGGEEYLSSPVAVYAQYIFKRSKELMHKNYYAAASDYLTKLIGLGVGLTPSGDDFLCGVLAALTMRDTNSELLSDLKTKISQRLDLTNDISSEFLRCACEGNFSQTVTRLPDFATSAEITASFSKIGHSSGADTLNGILFVFSQIDR